MKALAATLLLAWCAATGAALHVVATPCKTEDSTFCTWDAAARSNGKGISFIAVTPEIIIPTSHTSK